MSNHICSRAVNIHEYTVHQLLEISCYNYYLAPCPFRVKTNCSSYLKPMAIREGHYDVLEYNDWISDAILLKL